MDAIGGLSSQKRQNKGPSESDAAVPRRCRRGAAGWGPRGAGAEPGSGSAKHPLCAPPTPTPTIDGTRWLQDHLAAPPVVPAHPRALYFVSFANSAAARAALPLQPEGWITHAGAAAAVVRANNVVAHAAAAAARHGAQTPSTASRRTEAKPPVP